MKKWIFLIWGVFFALTFFYTKDLQQENPEYLFLSDQGKAHYNNFLKDVDENKILIITLTFQKNITKDSLEKYFNFSSSLQKIIVSDNVRILNLVDIYPHLKTSSIAKKIKYFEQKNRPVQLMGEKQLSYLVTIGESRSHQDTRDLVKKVIHELEVFKKSGGISFKLAGFPYVNYKINHYSKEIKDFLFPLIFILSYLFLLMMTRRVDHSLFIFFPSLFSSLIGLTFIKVFFLSMNMITAIVPMLIFIINLSLSLHLFYTTLRTRSFKKAFKEKFIPICLMVGTTTVGFAALYISELEIVKQFSLSTSISILFTSVITCLWLYFVSDSYIVPKIKTKSNTKKIKKILSSRYFSKSLAFPYILLLLLISLPVGYFSYTNMPIVTNAISFFPKNKDIRQNIQYIHEHVVGTPLAEVIIKNKGKRFEYSDLVKLDNWEKKLKEEEGFNLLSLNRFVTESNEVYTKLSKIPDNKYAYLGLVSQINPHLQNSYPLSSIYRMTILGNIQDNKSYEKFIAKIKKNLDRLNYDYEINGLNYNLMSSHHSMISTLIKSFLLTLIVISFLILFYFKDLRMFIIFIIVNIIPMFIGMTGIYILNFSINIATIMTISMAMGLIVDSTIHLLYYFKKSQKILFEEYYDKLVKPILGSSLLLIFCFIMMGLHDFLPIRQFGIFLTILVFLGMIFDFYVLPTLYLKNNQLKK